VVGEEALPRDALGLALEAVPENVPVARRAVADYARSCQADVTRVALAVSEAVTNVVLHAYRNPPAGSVRVRAEMDRSDLVVTVADEGPGMRPNPDSPGLGMGLAIIGSTASDIELHDTGAGLELRMRFPCAGD
jgi:serine/threonine-protein kinase RsbW